MSVDYSAVIARGFVVTELNYEDYPDEFIDQWVINFDSWSDGPYLIGYQISSCEEGYPYELGCTLGNPLWDTLLLKACEEVNLPIGLIKTYFGVKVS